MADPEHLKILSRGVEWWNRWRAENPEVEPDLRGVQLNAAFLVGINFSNTFLLEATIINSEAALADFTGAFLKGVNFSETTLKKASLRSAILTWTVFSHSKLAGADFTDAHLGWTTFGDNDLSEVKGLDAANHTGPSIVGVETIYRSHGHIPEAFLRGCGVPDEFIVNASALVTARNPFQFYSCFISYSTQDERFVRRLYSRMRDEHLRVWFAPEDVKGGEKLYEQIDRAIQVHDRLLLVLSESSLQSRWVMTEIRRARKVELKENRRKLFPIRLVDFDALQKWECFDVDTGEDLASEVRQYFIPDFSNWKDHDAFERAFEKLLRDLRAEETNEPTYMTPDSLERRAVLSPRNTIIEEWDKVTSLIVKAAKRNGLVVEGELVSCGRLINQLYEAGKISEAVREEFFILSKWHHNVAFNTLAPVEPGEAINFVNKATELQSAFAVDTPPLP